MTIISWNVNGIRAVVKKDFFTSVEKLKADILCIQETKAQDKEVDGAISSLNNYEKYYNSAEKKGYSGTALLSKTTPLGITNDMGVPEHDMEGRGHRPHFVHRAQGGLPF